MQGIKTDDLARGLAKRYNVWAAEHVTPYCKTLEQVQKKTAEWLASQFSLPPVTMLRIASVHVKQKKGNVIVSYRGIASAILKQIDALEDKSQRPAQRKARKRKTRRKKKKR